MKLLGPLRHRTIAAVMPNTHDASRADKAKWSVGTVADRIKGGRRSNNRQVWLRKLQAGPVVCAVALNFLTARTFTTSPIRDRTVC